MLRQLDRYDAARGPLVAYLLGIARHDVFKRLAVSCSESPLDAAGVDESACLLNTRSWICPRPRRHILHPTERLELPLAPEPPRVPELPR